MSAERPALEPIWVVEATYAPDAEQRRTPLRAEHLARIRQLKAAGTVIEAGAFSDVSASLLLVRGRSEQEVLVLARADVYFGHGVWTQLRARPFGRVV